MKSAFDMRQLFGDFSVMCWRRDTLRFCWQLLPSCCPKVFAAKAGAASGAEVTAKVQFFARLPNAWAHFWFIASFAFFAPRIGLVLFHLEDSAPQHKSNRGKAKHNEKRGINKMSKNMNCCKTFHSTVANKSKSD